MRFVSVQINTAVTVVSAIENTFNFNFKVFKADHSAGQQTSLDILVASLKDIKKYVLCLF